MLVKEAPAVGSFFSYSWWRHEIETFSALLAFCAGTSPVTGKFPAQKQWRGALMFSLICTLHKRLSKQSRGWWFETPSRSLWRHCNVWVLYLVTVQHHWIVWLKVSGIWCQKLLNRRITSVLKFIWSLWYLLIFEASLTSSTIHNEIHIRTFFIASLENHKWHQHPAKRSTNRPIYKRIKIKYKINRPTNSATGLLAYKTVSQLKVKHFNTTWYHFAIIFRIVLTHWGRVPHICVGNLTIIGPDNGLSPGRRQAIIRTNAGLLSNGPLRTCFSENLIKKTQEFSFKKMLAKMSGKWRPSCLDLNMFMSNRSGSSDYTFLESMNLKPEPIWPAAECFLTHWGRVTHICVSKLTIIGSDKGLSP